MNETFALRDVLQLAMMIFAVGAFVNEARSTKKLVDKQAVAMKAMDGRIVEIEKVQLRQTALLERTASTLDKVEGKLERHMSSSKCSEHEAGIRELRADVNSVRGEVTHLRDRFDSLEVQK